MYKTYRVNLSFGDFHFRADLTEASAPIFDVGVDGEDIATPFQTADARHREHEAAKLILESNGPEFYLPEGVDEEEALAGYPTLDEYLNSVIVSIVENPVKLDELRGLDWQVSEAEVSMGDVSPAVGDGSSPGYAPAESSFVGHVLLSARLRDELIALIIQWQASGNTTGTFRDLYDFDIEVWQDAPEDPISLDVGLDIDGELPAQITLIDEDGEEEVEPFLGRALDTLAAETASVWKEAVEDLLPKCPEPEDVDEDEDETMETITLERDDDRDVRFAGERVAEVSSHHYEGPRNTRWTELTLYRTTGGKWVCQEVGVTCWQGEHDRHAVHIADSEEALIRQLGTGWLAKALYANAGIECVEEVE